MSSSLPPAVLRAAIVKVVGRENGAALFDDAELARIAEQLEEQGYLIVARADVHALRAAADKVLRFAPAPVKRHEFKGIVRCTECGYARADTAVHW